MVHDGSPGLCVAHECLAYLRADAEVNFLRKHAVGVSLMFPGVEVEGGKSDGEDTSADAI